MANGASAPFRMATRRNRQMTQDMAFTGPGQFQRVDIPQVGYLADIWIKLYGTIVTGTSSAGSYSNYFPWNILQSLSLRSNEGLEIYRTNGYSNLLIQSVMRPSFSPNMTSAGTTTLGSTSGMQTAVRCGPAAGSARADSTTYNINVLYHIPVACDRRLSAGLLLLQNQATRLQLELQTNQYQGNGGINGIGTSTFALGSGGSLSLTARTVCEFFAVPPDPASQPDLTFVHRWIEDSVSWTTTGNQQYLVPVNGVISRVICDVENNGTPQIWFTGADPNAPTVGNSIVTYAASNSPETEDATILLGRQRYLYEADLPNGCLVWEFSDGAGGVEMGWDGRDVYDTALLTQFAVTLNISATPTSGKIRYIRQELQRRAA